MRKTNFFFMWITILAIVLNATVALGQIQIANRADLENIATDLSGSYVLTDNIDLSGADWTPIATSSQPFTGTLDGAGYKIIGLHFNQPNSDQIGLFRETNNATIKKIGFEQANIVGNANTGLIVGWAKNTVIEELYVANSYIEGRDHTGAIAGALQNGCILRNCWSNARVKSRDYQGGGLVGILSDNAATISKCYFSGIVQCPSRPTGIMALTDADNNGNVKLIEKCLVLAPYIIGGGNLRIGDDVGNGNRALTLDKNYGLSTTKLGGNANVLNGNPVLDNDINYGANKRHGADIPNGDANAKAAGLTDFYINHLDWDFTGTWKFLGDGYPQLKWQQTPVNISFLTLTATQSIQADNKLSLKSGETIDLATSLVLNNNVTVTYSSGSDKVEISGSSLNIKGSVTIVAPEEITVSITPTSSDFTCPQALTVLLLPTEPIQLSTAEDLALLNVAPTLWFELAANIDLTDQTFTMIENFGGILDGKGHVIKGLTYNNISTRYVGLIRHLSGTIKNLGLENANIIGNEDTGGIAGETTSGARIENCYVIHSYIEGRDHTGAVIGGMKRGGTVINTYANARVHSREHQAGGITGIMQRDDLIENCYYAGVVSNASNRAVGIGGYQDDSGAPVDHYPTIKNSVCLSPYLLTPNYENDAIRIFHNNGDRPYTLVNNYGLTTTLRSKTDFSLSSLIEDDDLWATTDGKHGAQVTPAGALTQTFYETTLGWNFTDVWEMRSGAYPVLQGQAATLATEPALKYKYGYAHSVELQKENTAGIDLSRHLPSGYGFEATLVADETDKITVDGGVVKVNASFIPITVVNTTVRFISSVSGFTINDAFTVNIIPAVSFTDLSVAEGTLSPAFDPTILEYTLSVDGSVDAITITAETGSGISIQSGSGRRSIDYGHNTLSVVATNGSYDKTYTIKVDRGLFSVADLHGNGKRRVNIKSWIGGGSNTESPYKLLIGKDAINGNTGNKWCPTGGDAIREVVFAFADIYEVGAIEIRDKGVLEGTSGQFDDWTIATSLDGDNWTEAGHWTGEESITTKYHTFTPAEARYLKFTINQPGTRWIYGVDIYGKYVAPSDPKVVSRGKTILSYSGGYWEGQGRETPANILDGLYDDCNPWASFEDGQSVEIDLESVYQIGGFKLRNQQDGNDNISAYKVSTKQNVADEWSAAIEIAMPSGGGGVVTGSVQSGNLALATPLTARYVKLEIPAEYKNRTTGWIRIKEFEVYQAGAYTWTGHDDNDWTNTDNWQEDIVPIWSDKVTIPADADNYPVLTATTSVGHLLLEANAELGGQHHLTIAGNTAVTYDLAADRWYLLSSPMETTAQAFHHNDAPEAGLKKFTPSGSVAGWSFFNSLETPIDLGEGFAYRLVDEAKEFTVSGRLYNETVHQQTVNFGSDLGSAFALVGNPFVSTIDFEQLVADNNTILSGSYLIWTDAGGYTGFNTATHEPWGLSGHDLTSYIAPLQSFIVEKLGGDAYADVDIVSNASIQAVGQSAVGLRTDDAPANLLSITAGNATASVRTFVAQRESGNSSRKLFAAISEVPDIYTLDGTTAYGARIVNTDNITIPLGIATTSTETVRLTFTGMDSYNAKITLIDNTTEIGLTDLSSYIHEVTLSGAGAPVENRFAIRLAPKQGTGIDSISTDHVVTQRYYNLQGVWVAEPVEAGIYMVKTIFQSGKASVSKVLIR